MLCLVPDFDCLPEMVKTIIGDNYITPGLTDQAIYPKSGSYWYQILPNAEYRYHFHHKQIEHLSIRMLLGMASMTEADPHHRRHSYFQRTFYDHIVTYPEEIVMTTNDTMADKLILESRTLANATYRNRRPCFYSAPDSNLHPRSIDQVQHRVYPHYISTDQVKCHQYPYLKVPDSQCILNDTDIEATEPPPILITIRDQPEEYKGKDKHLGYHPGDAGGFVTPQTVQDNIRRETYAHLLRFDQQSRDH